MQFLRSVNGFSSMNKQRNEDIRNKLNIFKLIEKFNKKQRKGLHRMDTRTDNSSINNVMSIQRKTPTGETTEELAIMKLDPELPNPARMMMGMVMMARFVNILFLSVKICCMKHGTRQNNQVKRDYDDTKISQNQCLYSSTSYVHACAHGYNLRDRI